MQMLKAGEEKPLFTASLSVDILKLTNPMSSYAPYVSEMDSSLQLGKHPRVKTTVPKQPRESMMEEQNSSTSCDSDIESSPIFHTPPNTPPFEKMSKRAKYRTVETPTLHSFDEGFQFSDESFRRFSSRSRKQTHFLGVGSEEAEVDTERKRSRPRGRKLLFSPPPVPALKRDIFGQSILKDEDRLQVTGSKDTVEQQQEAEGDENTITSATTPAVVKQAEEKPQDDSVPEDSPAQPVTREWLEESFRVGTMVWGKLPGYCWWPGMVISYGGPGAERDDEGTGESNVQAWVKWFGETQLSRIAAEKLCYFHEFKEYFQPLQLKGTYKKAILAAVKEAAKRCKVTFLSSSEDKKLRWIMSDDSPLPKLIIEHQESPQTPPTLEEGVEAPILENKADQKEPSSHENSAKGKPRGRGKRGRAKGEKMAIRLTALEQEMIEWAYGGFLPGGKEGLLPAPEEDIHVQVVPVEARNNEERSNDDMPRKKRRVMMLQVRSRARFHSVLEGRANLSDMCIGCGDLNIIADHPFFRGGLCVECKNDFMESAYLFDEDGSQMYCTICSAGEEVFMCDVQNCSKVYCAMCVEKLCGSAELNRVKESEKWLCYMCSPEHSHIGLLEKREDWDKKLRELFLNDHEMEYDLPAFHPTIPPEERRPIRVLGLFDGIATGLVALKELGVEVTKYVSSEIDTDAIFVSMVQHNEIEHVGDVASITEKEIEAWGPFDLVIGGSPCNDLSVVNPARRGIYEGTGRLFFEFYRILNYVKPAVGEERPFFWLFENVVSMKPQDKQTISRFLQSNPVVVDAKDISPAHRARYFWGNLPGMNRPTSVLPSDRLTLQSCLEPNCYRVAQFTKLRTITTKMNSIKQTKKAIFPVRFEGGSEEEEGDVLWCTEMERLFGFPEHYTDVGNLGRAGRQRLLGKAWSVPVIRHLFSPLKEYFKSSTTKQEGVAAIASGHVNEHYCPRDPPIASSTGDITPPRDPPITSSTGDITPVSPIVKLD